MIPSNATLPVSHDILAEVCALYRPRAEAAGYSTPQGATLRCGEATEDFTQFLCAAIPGIDMVTKMLLDFHLIGDRALYPIDVSGYRQEHVFTLVGNCAVDWTARQFDTEAPCPLIFLVPLRALL